MSQSDTIKTQLRLPSDLHLRLVECSSRTGRSMNAEIVHRLERSLELQAEDVENGAADLRVRIAAARELAQSNIELLNEYLVNLGKAQVNAVGPEISGKTLREMKAEVTEALGIYRASVNAASILLAQLAVADAMGSRGEADDIRRRAKDLGLI